MSGEELWVKLPKIEESKQLNQLIQLKFLEDNRTTVNLAGEYRQGN